jgi:hypothetical protein
MKKNLSMQWNAPPDMLEAREGGAWVVIQTITPKYTQEAPAKYSPAICLQTVI